MEGIKNLKIKIKDFFEKKQSKKAAYILLLGCIGMLLVCISEFVPEESNKTQSSDQVFSSSDSFSKEKALEIRLEEIISKINGAGKTAVMITFSSSNEYFLAENITEEKDETENSRKTETVIIDGENGEEPIILKTSEAEIRGVLVICDGGENAVVREKIIEAICALLDVPSNRVSVAKMA